MSQKEVISYLESLGRCVVVSNLPKAIKVATQDEVTLDWQWLRDFEWPWAFDSLAGRTLDDQETEAAVYLDKGSVVWIARAFQGGVIGAREDASLLDRLQCLVKHPDCGFGWFDDKLEYSEYDPAPINTACFFWTGGDGIHLNLLDIGNGFNLDSPIVYTNPSGGLERKVVARNLEEFLVCYCEYGFYWFDWLDGFNQTLEEVEESVSCSLDSEKRSKLAKLKKELSIADAPPLAEVFANLPKLQVEFQHLIGPSVNDFHNRMG